MSQTTISDVAADARARANVKRLAVAQALGGANSAVIFATGAIIGSALAPSASLATVPLSVYVVGLASGTLPTGMIARSFGRRVAFMVGSGAGALCGYSRPSRFLTDRSRCFVAPRSSVASTAR